MVGRHLSGAVSRKVNLSLRNDILSWGHHRAVAKLSAEKQKHWIDLAANHPERIVRFILARQ